MDKIENHNAALADAILDRDSKGRFREPHAYRRTLEVLVAERPNWALHVLKCVVAHDQERAAARARGKEFTTPREVAHWVTFGCSARLGLAAFVARMEAVKAARGTLTPADRARLHGVAQRYVKQAVAVALLKHA